MVTYNWTLIERLLHEVQNADSIDLKHLATTAALLLRDGCDLLNALGGRLQPK